MVKHIQYKRHQAILNYTSGVFVFLLSIAVSILSFTPPISRDALTHHLYIPKLWLQHGNIDPITHIVFSYYPMNLDLLYTIALNFGNDILPKFIHFSFALWTAWLTFSYLRERINILFGVFGALFFLSLPIIVKLSITVYVDLGLIAFTTASLLMLFKWAESNKVRHLIFAGIFCGLAAGTKYNGLISIFLLTSFTPLIFIRSYNGGKKYLSIRAAGFGLLFLVITLLTFSPWMMRNYELTGNPIYPLHNSLFAKNKTDTIHASTNNSGVLAQAQTVGTQLTTRGSSTFANRKILYNETWWQAMLLPIRLFFEGQDDNPRFFDGKLNPFLLILMLLTFYKNSYSRQVKLELIFLFSFGWLFFFLTFFQGSLRIRYIATALPCFIILATFGIHNLYHQLQAGKQKTTKSIFIILVLIIIPTLTYNALYIYKQFNYLKPFSFISGEVSRDNYIARYLPEYPLQKYANDNLQDGDKILAIYVGGRGYYFDFPVVFDINGKNSTIGTIVTNSQTDDEIYQELKKMGFTHLFIRLKLFTKGANENLTREKVELLNRFLVNNTKQLATNSTYGLFKLIKNSQQ